MYQKYVHNESPESPNTEEIYAINVDSFNLSTMVLFQPSSFTKQSVLLCFV